MIRSEGQFEARLAVSLLGKVQPRSTTLFRQHLRDVELSHTVADAVVNTDDQQQAALDKIGLYAEELQWLHGWMSKGGGWTQVFGQKELLAKITLAEIVEIVLGLVGEVPDA